MTFANENKYRSKVKVTANKNVKIVFFAHTLMKSGRFTSSQERIDQRLILRILYCRIHFTFTCGTCNFWDICLSEKPMCAVAANGVRSSRRQTNSATTNSATRVGQLGDNLFPAFHYTPCLKKVAHYI